MSKYTYNNIYILMLVKNGRSFELFKTLFYGQGYVTSPRLHQRGYSQYWSVPLGVG